MIKWELKLIDLTKVDKYHKNPRGITDREREELNQGLQKFGMIDKPILNPSEKGRWVIIGGHQRIDWLRLQGTEKAQCWVPSRKLTEQEVEELNIRLNANSGHWDEEVIRTKWAGAPLGEWAGASLPEFLISTADGNIPGFRPDGYMANNKEVELGDLQEKIEVKVYLSVEDFQVFNKISEGIDLAEALMDGLNRMAKVSAIDE